MYRLEFLDLEDKLKKSDKPVTVGPYTLSLNDADGFVVEGRDRKGKTWKIVRNFNGLGTDIYAADLASDGEVDLVIVSPTAGCGMAPSTAVCFILIDKLGSPHVIDLQGYNRINAKTKKNGIEDIVTLDGKPVFVFEDLVPFEKYNKLSTRLFAFQTDGLKPLVEYEGQKLPIVARVSTAKDSTAKNASVKQEEESPYPAEDFALLSDEHSGKRVPVKIEHFEPLKAGSIRFTGGKDLSWGAGFRMPYIYIDHKDKLLVLSVESDKGVQFLTDAQKSGTELLIIPSARENGMPLSIWVNHEHK